MAAISGSGCICSPPVFKQQTQSTFFKSVFSVTVGELLPANVISVSRRFRSNPIVVVAVGSKSLEYTYSSSPAKKLREILESPCVHQGPCCFDALSAKLVERAGFRYSVTSEFSISAARLGLPDTGLISYGEMADQGQQITQAVSIPIIGDGGQGYGNAMNIKRTVKGFINAGFAGVILNDKVFPEASSNKNGRKVASREEAVDRIRAAVDARKESGADIVIVAQTDSAEEISLDESLWRARAFTDAGADVLFASLVSREQMKDFCKVYPLIPKMVSMVEGGAKAPILSPLELEEIGYRLVTYPISLMGVSIQAMRDGLLAIKGGRIPPPGRLPSLEEINEILGYEEAEEYSTFSSDRVSSKAYGIQRVVEDCGEEKNSEDSTIDVITPDVYNGDLTDRSREPFTRIRSRSLRIKITSLDGFEKLDIRIPAGFLEGVTNIVPALGGVNLKQLLDDAADDAGKILLDFNDSIGDRIQVFLE